MTQETGIFGRGGPVVTPPTFGGRQADDVRAWLVRFERAAKANGWGSHECLNIAPAFLRDLADHWYEEHKEGLLTWAVFKETVTRQFSPIDYEETMTFKLASLRQGHEEPVTDFTIRFKGIAAKTTTVMDSQKLRLYNDALLSEIREKVIMARPLTLDEAYSVALLAEKSMAPPVAESRRPVTKPWGADRGNRGHQTYKPSTRTPPRTAEPRPANQDEARPNVPANEHRAPARATQADVDELTSKMQRMTVKKIDSGHRPRAHMPVYCFVCGEEGHVSYYCSKRAEPKVPTMPVRLVGATEEEEEGELAEEEDEEIEAFEIWPNGDGSFMLVPVYRADKRKAEHSLDAAGSKRRVTEEAMAFGAATPTVQVTPQPKASKTEEKVRIELKVPKTGPQSKADGDKAEKEYAKARPLDGASQPLAKPLAVIPLCNAPYSITSDLRKAKADITFAQLLQASPSLRRDLTKGMATAMGRQEGDTQAACLHVAIDAPSKTVDKKVVGHVNEELVSITLDGGSLTNLVNVSFVEKAGLTYKPGSKWTIEVADGGAVKPLGEIHDLPLVIADMPMKINALVMASGSYELLLGKPWLQSLKAYTSWQDDVTLVSWFGDLVQLPTFDDAAALLTKESPERIAVKLISQQELSEEMEDALDDFLIDMARDLEDGSGSEDPPQNLLAVPGPIQDVLSEFISVFAQSEDDIGRTSIVTHAIPTGASRPVSQRLYRSSPADSAAIKAEVERLLSLGLIEPSTAPWSSPVILVRKKDGSLRMCVDYRRLNAVTVKDKYPLPLIPDMLDALAGSKVFSSLDLLSGYHQVAIDEEDKPKTTFTTKYGNFQFKVMPFGLCNAPSTFQSLMNAVLTDLLDKCALVYLDDVVVYSKSVEDHAKDLAMVLERLQAAGLKAKRSKCKFGQEKLEFLGHVVGSEGVAVSERLVEKLLDMPVPRNLTAVRAFIGLASYYRRFVKDFASIAEPLTRLTRSGLQFKWGHEQQAAFESLRAALASSEVMAHPDFSKQFILQTDASGVGLGAVLAQMSENGAERPVAYLSRQLSGAEKNYTTTELELLAVVYTLKQWRHYLLGSSFVLVTDHAALRYLREKNAHTGRLARWVLLLQEYDFAVRHRAGSTNQNADALSRLPAPDPRPSDVRDAEDHQLAAMQVAPMRGMVMPVDRRWSLVTEMHDYLTTGVLPEHLRTPASMARFISAAKAWSLVDGVLYRVVNRRKLVVPSQLNVERYLREAHDGNGHFGAHASYLRLSRKAWWTGMRKDMEQYVAACLQCQRRRAARDGVPMHPHRPSRIFETVALDFVGPLPSTALGHNYLLVAVDHGTRWPEAWPCATNDAATVARLFYEGWISRYGPPATLLTDNGTHFTAALIREMCDFYDMQHRTTSPYNPRSNGMVEKLNGSIVDALAKYVDGEVGTWDHHLAHVLYAIRTNVHAVTRLTPFQLLYGVEHPVQVEAPAGDPDMFDLEGRADELAFAAVLRDQAYELSDVAAGARKEKHDAQHTDPPEPLEVGDLVLLDTPRSSRGKLDAKNKGPFKIADVYANDVYLLVDGNSRVRGPAHRRRLVKYVRPPIPKIRIPALFKGRSGTETENAQHSGGGIEAPTAPPPLLQTLLAQARLAQAGAAPERAGASQSAWPAAVLHPP